MRSEKDVMRAIRSKRGVFDKACGVKFVSTEIGNPRFVIVVSTRVSKSSVERNKVRRQYREICKKFIPDLPSADIALLVSKPALELSFQDMRDQLQKTFVKAKLLAK